MHCLLKTATNFSILLSTKFYLKKWVCTNALTDEQDARDSLLQE